MTGAGTAVGGLGLLGGGPGGPVRALLVDAEVRTAQLLVPELHAMGWRARTTDRGRAVRVAGEFRPHVLVLDLSGSEWDGLSPLHRLRADAVTDVPVLVLSARAEASDRIAGLHAGADDYLGKPFHLPELIARLANLARRSGPRPTPSGPQLRAGDLLLDEDTREVRRGEDLIHLSPKEFAVLNLFMRNPMRVLGRAEIHRQVWGEHGEGSDKIVEIYLCQLRKKIDRGGAPMIHTLRGAGYILKAAPSAVPAVEGSR